MNGRARGAVVVWLAVLSGLFAGRAARTNAQRPDTIVILSSAGKCLDADAETLDMDGGRVRVWECNNKDQQVWHLFGNEIRSAVNNKKCLEVVAEAQYMNGGRVQIWDCNKSMQQQWKQVKNEIRSGAGKCLDVDAGSQYRDGAIVQVWDCNGEPQQRWTIKFRGQ